MSMTEPSRREVSPEQRSLPSGSEQMPPAIPRALWAALAGYLLVLIAAVTDSVPPNTAIVAVIACSIIAVAALTVNRQPRPLTMAPRVAAIALVVQALLQRYAASEMGPATPL